MMNGDREEEKDGEIFGKMLIQMKEKNFNRRFS
jgi:hypothetical protein